MSDKPVKTGVVAASALSGRQFVQKIAADIEERYAKAVAAGELEDTATTITDKARALGVTVVTNPFS